MSKTKIDWATDVINCVTGCRKGCEYCYAREVMAPRLKGRFGYDAEEPFKPTFHPDKLQDLIDLKGKNKRVFLDSMGDFFSEGMNPDWIHTIIEAIWEKPEHHFLVLTKWPERIPEMLHCIDLPPNLWLGVSVTCQADVWRIKALVDNTPEDTKKFISFEPLHGPIRLPCKKLMSKYGWAIVGAETGRRPGKVVPLYSWVWDLCHEIIDDIRISLFVKDNIAPNLPEGVSLIQEFPEEMR